MNAVFQQCSQNLNTRQVFWNVLSVTLVTMTVMTKYDPWAYRPLSLWRPDLDSFSLLWSHVKRLSILWSYWLQTTSYLCLEPLFPGAVQKNTNFRNLRWEHHLCSENDRCPEITVFCLQVTDSDFCLKWSDVRCDWPQEVCDMVWRLRCWWYHPEPSLMLSYHQSRSTTSHPWPLMNPGLYQWFILSVAAIKFMICQFKIVNGNMEFLQSLNNWVIHTSSISGPGLESGWREARGWGMWRCNYQLIRPKQVTVRGGWGGLSVLRRIVLLLVVSAVGLFLSYQWWPTLG